MPPPSSTRLNSKRENMRSPAASGIDVASASRAYCSACSASTGSSTNKGRSGSSAFNNGRAIGSATRPWKSSPKSMLLPKAARTSATTATARSTARTESSIAISWQPFSLKVSKPPSRRR